MCVACLRTQVDISEGIPKQVTVNFCKQCERFVSCPLFFFSTHLFQDTKNTSLYPYRKHLQVQLFQIFCLYGWGLNVHRPPPCRYLQPPATWMQCALESRELLALCLKKIKSSMTKVSVIRTKLQKAHFQSQKFQWTLQVNSHVCIVSIVLPWFFQPYVIFMFNVFLLSWTSSS